MAFATSDQVRDYLDGNSVVDDDLLDRLCESATALIKNFCGRGFEQGPYEDVWIGRGTNRRRLREAPVVSVSAVYAGSVLVPAASYQLAGDILLLDGYSFPRGLKCSIAYVAGYETDEMPADVVQACIDLAASKYRERTRVGQSSMVLSGSGETIAFLVDDLPPNTKRILSNYSRWAV